MAISEETLNRLKKMKKFIKEKEVGRFLHWTKDKTLTKIDKSAYY